MRSVAEFAMVREEHEKTRVQLEALPDSDLKRELLEKFAESARVANECEKLTHEALNRERAKLN